MKLIFAIMFIATSLLASESEYATIFQPAGIPSDSRLMIRQNIQAIGGDIKLVPYASTALWRLKSDHNITGYMECMRTDNIGVKGFKNITLPQLEAQVTHGVRPPDKHKVIVMTRVKGEEDYEPVPVVEP